MTREEAKRRMEICRNFLANNYSDMGEPNFTAFNMAIQALSQEPTDTWSIKEVADTFKKHGLIREQEPCDDAISRDAVLSIIDGWYEQNRETENIEDLIILITYMDSVTPKSRECEDVISRAEVKRIVDFYKEQYDGIYHINESIDNLPSVTQKSGKWDRLYSWLNDMRLGIAPDETVDDIDERHCRESQTDILDEIMEWMIKAESEDKE